jgi:acyl dehydratase
MGRQEFEFPDGFAFTTKSRGRTITEGEFAEMTNLTWTFEEIHTDKVMMAEKWGHERMLAGGCVLAFALGLATPSILPQTEDRGIKLIALVGYDRIRFESPLFPGDTVYIESMLDAVLRTSKPERGVIRFKDVLVDHTGRRILSYERSALCDISKSVLFDGRANNPDAN